MSRYAIGIDLGGTNTSFGIIDGDGHILAKGGMPTTGHGTIEAFMAAVAEKVAPLISKVGKDNIVGIGIGAPNGNFYTGEIVFAPNLPWKGVLPLAKLLTTATGIKTTVTNDAKAAAMGEMIYGAAKNMKDFILVTLGTGLGSGFVANGKLIYGHDGMAGELGHTTAVRNGRRCNCGRNGCLERYVSATGVVLTAEDLLATTPEDSVLRQSRGAVTSKMVFEAASGGDQLAIRVFEITGAILGQSMADATAITSPEAIILFGGMAHAGELLMAPFRRAFEENLLAVYQNKIKLLFSALPDSDAAILGAGALAWAGEA